MTTAISRVSLDDQLTLRIDQEFSKQLDSVIEAMQVMAKNFRIKEVKERSPLKNVVAVSTEATSSLEVIKNYIRYQSGRKESTSKIWQCSITKDGKKQIFAQAVVQQIDALSNNVTTIFEDIKIDLDKSIEVLQGNQASTESENTLKDVNAKEDSTQVQNLKALKQYLETNQSRLRQSIHLKLTQHYLGYLSREHTALIGGFEA
jgi:hypothetical protein